MPRRPCPRRIASPPRYTYFKPAGVPMSALEEIELSIDEFEALRLADLEGLYQEEAAARMEVSRATFARIVEASRRKVAAALVHGNALRIGGGPVAFAGQRSFRCESCRHDWTLPFGTGRPPCCPACSALGFRRVDAGPGSTPRSSDERPGRPPARRR